MTKHTALSALAGAAAFTLVMTPFAANAVVVLESAVANPGSYAGLVQSETVDLPDGSSWAIGAVPSIRTGNIGVSRSPFDETTPLVGGFSTSSGFPESTPYFSVGPDNPDNPAMLEFSQNQREFSFLWGSPDSYNELTFTLDNVVVGFFAGTAVQPPTAVGSSFVNFRGTFDTVTFFSDGSNAFEWSSMSATAVPLPAAAWMMLAGLASLGFVARRKRAAA